MICHNNALIRSTLLKSLRCARINNIRCDHSDPHVEAVIGGINKIGSREVVGYGISGEPNYFDDPQFPFPAIRYREITPDLKALKEKERGDWRSLTIEEKKCLYRISFRQTFSEMVAPVGDNKEALGLALIISSVAMLLYIVHEQITKNPDGLPKSFDLDCRRAQLKRMLDLKMNPITGISSYWDYENNKWK